MPVATNAVSPGLLDAVRTAAHPLTGTTTDYDPLLRLIGNARFVLLGEASHGTHEFYRERARITKRLVTEKGFSAVAVEADWPDAYRVNRYVRDMSQDTSGAEALVSFHRFPAPRLERAIRVLYRPETERLSHYFSARLSGQFDAVLHCDETRAVEPLERGAPWETGEAPETFPFGR